ncbi:MAG: winged helix-turn-helix domain-containing protein [Candidatus Hodarchaeota archaeon]
MGDYDEALEHSTRRNILKKLQKKKAFLVEISRDLNIPTSTAAYHLKRLTRVGLIDERRGVYHVWFDLSERGRSFLEQVNPFKISN